MICVPRPMETLEYNLLSDASVEAIVAQILTAQERAIRQVGITDLKRFSGMSMISAAAVSLVRG